jgi:hypothetical protein
MLSTQIQELLTAYVDGELSARQRRAVQRLLHRSAEARALYHQLKGDSTLLRSLPRARLPQDLSQTVLDAITLHNLKLPRCVPVRPAATAPLSRFAVYAGMAAAAAVLLAVGTGSYLFFTSGPGSDSGPAVVRNQRAPAPSPVQVAKERTDPVAPQERPESAEPQPAGWPERPEMPPPIRLVTHPLPTFVAGGNLNPGGPTPPERPIDPLAIPHELPDPQVTSLFDVPKPRLLLLHLRQLDQPKPLKDLQAELQRDNAFRLELFSANPARALERLQAAFRTQGIVLRIDSEVPPRLKLRPNLALFAENLTREELVQILQKLGADDRAAVAGNARDGLFGEASVLKPQARSDRDELANLLGVDWLKLVPPRTLGKLGVNLHQPLSEGTADQVALALSGQTPRPAAATPDAGKATERSALLFLHRNDVRPPVSRDVKQFMDSRKEARAGTVQLFLVLRSH